MDNSSNEIDSPLAKPQLRSRLLAARRVAGSDPAATGRVQAILRALVTGLTGRTIAAYAPMRTEPGGRDLPAVLSAALGPTGRLLLPVVRPDHDLDWAEYAGDLAPAGGGWTGGGLAEPTGPRLGADAVAAADLVVVPALAVDRRGVRLGRGAGCYDRALARVRPGVPVVALLHDGELLDQDLPAEPHDRPVTTVVTPGAGLVRLTPPLDSGPSEGA